MTEAAPETVYDLAVVGGGVAGAAVARDAAQRGLSVVLLEKNTLASGASSKSSKLIHGGLRYLESAWLDAKRLRLRSAFRHLRFVASSLRETRILSRTAPALVRPLRLLIPVYRGREHAPWAVYAGALFYGALSRLAGNPERTRLLRGPRAVLEALPLLEPEGLAGAVEIADYTTDDAALVRALAADARRFGARILERTAVRRWTRTGPEGLFEIEAGGMLFRSRRLVDAAGAWIDRLRGPAADAAGRYVAPVGGSHLELPAFLGRSVILEARDGRVFFVIEKGGRARVGTTEWPCEDPDRVSPPPADIEYLLASLERYFPSKRFAAADVLGSDAGVRPLAVDPSAPGLARLSREHAVRADADGAIHAVGVKLTDHRRAAEEIVDRVMRSLGRNKRSSTASTPLEPAA